MPAGCRCLYPPPAPRMCSATAQPIAASPSLGNNRAAGQSHRFRPLAPPCSVVNCAAQAAPAACEGEGEAAARAVNIPHRLLDALEAHSKQHGRCAPPPLPPYACRSCGPPCAAPSPHLPSRLWGRLPLPEFAAECRCNCCQHRHDAVLIPPCASPHPPRYAAAPARAPPPPGNTHTHTHTQKRKLNNTSTNASPTCSEPVLVHISTDHVYDGGRSFYEEAAQLAPVNAYGRHVQPPHPSMSSAWFQAVGLPHDSCAVLGVPLPCAGRHAASGGRAGGSAGPLSEHGCWGLPSRLHPTRQGRCFPS
jgi:hypothetical protein